jgi:hypothetical protein
MEPARDASPFEFDPEANFNLRRHDQEQDEGQQEEDAALS